MTEAKKIRFCKKLNFEIQRGAAWCPHFMNKKVVNATAAIHAGMCGLCEYCEEKEGNSYELNENTKQNQGNAPR